MKENKTQWLIAVLGITFTVLQGFTTYYTRNVDARLNQIAVKLDETREMSIETAARLAAINQRLSQTESQLKEIHRTALTNQKDIAIVKAVGNK
ncbi:hypothetical protein [Pleionea sp. CnH1-48]|uniref:hypothetical protein n=1 Tax=Pleionea sp. CnH1-48 TaxID=2954494 RepID=UPI002096F7FE|nr:hypothetical protein [Pleionea sp. CnH1-48]MCO7225750.1 hypothetical protein [Pleionea sp. CnH1-48]